MAKMGSNSQQNIKKWLKSNQKAPCERIFYVYLCMIICVNSTRIVPR